MEQAFRETQQALVTQWHLSVPGDGADEPRERLLRALTRRVEHLLTHDMQRLLSALYVLDISEERFRDALDSTDTHSAAQQLAETILDRELEKAAMRRKYTEGERGEIGEST
jgi:hypothetical protein